MAQNANQEEENMDENQEKNCEQEEEDLEIYETIQDDPNEETTGDPLTCLIAFKKMVTDILDDNEIFRQHTEHVEY